MQTLILSLMVLLLFTGKRLETFPRDLAQIVAHISIDKNRLPDIGKHLSNVLNHTSNKAKFIREFSLAK